MEHELKEVIDRGHQSDKDLKDELSLHLVELGYEKLEVKTEQDLLNNLRLQIGILNNLSFSDSEWDRFFFSAICKRGEGHIEKLRKIQDKGYIKLLERDDGTTENVKLIDKSDIHNNKLQFLEVHSSDKEIDQRTTILLNGLPLIHIELKNPSETISSAFEKTTDKWKEFSFGYKLGFFDFIEIFVISTGKETRYYSCTTRNTFLENKYKTSSEEMGSESNGFSFTSYWSNEENRVYRDLSPFTKSFLEQKNIRELLINFSVLTNNNIVSDKPPNLKVMRPYQVYAVKKIIDRIKFSSKNDIAGSKESGGYIWHATGSGKTLTSFKAARLATEIEGIDKVLFVVDRKDLDYQTRLEYENYEKGASQAIKSSSELRNMLNNEESKIIITTIQKINAYLKNHSNEKTVFKKHMVFIFDECHRTQAHINQKGEKGIHGKIREDKGKIYKFSPIWVYGYPNI